MGRIVCSKDYDLPAGTIVLYDDQVYTPLNLDGDKQYHVVWSQRVLCKLEEE